MERIQCGNCGQSLRVLQEVPESGCPKCGAVVHVSHRLDSRFPRGRRGRSRGRGY